MTSNVLNVPIRRCGKIVFELGPPPYLPFGNLERAYPDTIVAPLGIFHVPPLEVVFFKGGRCAVGQAVGHMHIQLALFVFLLVQEQFLAANRQGPEVPPQPPAPLPQDRRPGWKKTCGGGRGSLGASAGCPSFLPWACFASHAACVAFVRPATPPRSQFAQKHVANQQASQQCGRGNRTAKTNNAISAVVLAVGVVRMAQDVHVVKVVRLKWKLW